MKSYHNIEKSAFKPGTYVGYARISGVWHIRGTSGNWYARCTTERASGVGAFFARTLDEVSKELSSR